MYGRYVTALSRSFCLPHLQTSESFVRFSLNLMAKYLTKTLITREFVRYWLVRAGSLLQA
jgi:hypothetical protein